MKKQKARAILDAPSKLGLYILTALSLGTTCIMAAIRSPRLLWTVITTLLLAVLTGINHLRLRARFKVLHGHGVHRKKQP